MSYVLAPFVTTRELTVPRREISLNKISHNKVFLKLFSRENQEHALNRDIRENKILPV